MFSETQKNQRNLTPEEKAVVDEQSRIATAKYKAVWYGDDGGYTTSDAYRKARGGKSVRYGNELLDCALALCGDPWYVMTGRHYCQEARDFLALFEQKETDNVG